ncbi:hypothetical protein SAY87_031689 [Trapa incisa]|uniref:Fe2OG dioxygenase domain-containing protein n=1 Tax=Trapa incisa TaxID=236973 RepID=A0AAN7KY67_9MYRT|nr:hypothetical protein SAY87_031689 [Trapa incisa]
MEAHNSSEPPLEQTVITLRKNQSPEISDDGRNHRPAETLLIPEDEESREFMVLPMIDISRLSFEAGHAERTECEEEIAEAARHWGFFQVVNHGIPTQVIEQMTVEQKKAFRQPFEVKEAGGGKLQNRQASSYRWGNPAAKCLRQMFWSEEFRIPTGDIYGIEDQSLRSAMEMYATAVTVLAEKIAGVLAGNLGTGGSYFRENCTVRTCHLRLNRYPPCPFSAEVFGIVPHTDSDFLTIVCQDAVGGLQLMKDDGCWVSVSPNPNALVINIGDMLEAWSNGAYKSARHRVITSLEEERFSIAFFYCPKSETVIRSCISPAIYRDFSFREYQLQVQKDVRSTGDKVGLKRFLV